MSKVHSAKITVFVEVIFCREHFVLHHGTNCLLASVWERAVRGTHSCSDTIPDGCKNVVGWAGDNKHLGILAYAFALGLVEAGEVAARWGTYNIEALTVRGNSLGHSWRVAAMTIARDFAFSRKRCGHCQGPQLDEHRAKPDIQCARYYGWRPSKKKGLSKTPSTTDAAIAGSGRQPLHRILAEQLDLASMPRGSPSCGAIVAAYTPRHPEVFWSSWISLNLRL